MRSYRALSALLATLVAGVLTVALVAFVPSAQAAKPRHDTSSVSAGEIRQSGKFYVKGTLKSFKNKVVRLEADKPGRGGYKPFTREKTNGRGYFYIKFDGKVGTKFRIVISETANNRRTVQFVGRIIRQ